MKQHPNSRPQHAQDFRIARKSIRGIAAILFVLAICLSHRAVAQSDSSRNEIGIRMDQFQRTNSRTTYPDMREGGNSRSVTGLELFGLRLGKRHNFIRFSIGGIHEVNHYVIDDSSSEGDRELDHLRSTQLITSSIAYGHDFAPFSGKVATRFHLRCGLSLTHEFLARNYTIYDETITDTAGNLLERTNEIVQGGAHTLKLRAFGQATFKLWKGLNVGIEWQVGPRIQFGQSRTQNAYFRYQNGLLEDVAVTRRSIPIRPRFETIELLGIPFLSLAWRF